jgi:1-deoxy-D-xylulose-5-phosphate synthase
MGGLGSAVLEFMGDHNYSAKVVRLGIPDKFVHHGTQDELYEECFYDAAAMVKSAKSLMKGIIIKASSMVG